MCSNCVVQCVRQQQQLSQQNICICIHWTFFSFVHSHCYCCAFYLKLKILQTAKLTGTVSLTYYSYLYSSSSMANVSGYICYHSGRTWVNVRFDVLQGSFINLILFIHCYTLSNTLFISYLYNTQISMFQVKYQSKTLNNV